MRPNSNLENEVYIMQEFLFNLRKIAGWSIDELSQKMGLTRQAVYALEHKQAKMNQLHFIALVYLFKAECKNNNNIFLFYAFNSIFNITDNSKFNINDETTQKRVITLILKLNELASIGKGSLLSDKTKQVILEGLNLIPTHNDDNKIIDYFSELSKKILSLGEKEQYYKCHPSIYNIPPTRNEKCPKVKIKKAMLIKKPIKPNSEALQ